MCRFVDPDSGHTQTPEIVRVHEMYSSMMSTVMSGTWRRGWPRKKIEGVRVESMQVLKICHGMFFFSMHIRNAHD